METHEQRDWVKWMEAEYPEYTKSIRVSMAGLPRHGRKGAVQWAMMKSQGVKKSEADIVLALPKGGYGSMVIEHKGEGMSRQLDTDQADYLEYHSSIGNFARSTRGLAELKSVTREYLGL